MFVNRILALVFLVSLPIQAMTVSPGQNPFLQVISKEILSRKCALYLAAEKSICKNISEKFLEFVDVNYEISKNGRQESTIVFLKAENQRIIREKKFPRYLNGIQQGLTQIQLGFKNEFDLYNYSLNFLGSDEEASLWIGVLFQDNNFKYHKEWLKQNIQNKKLLADYLSVYEFLSTGKKSLMNKINLYPASVRPYQQHFTGKLYYYYLPKILQTKLTKNLANSQTYESAEYNRVAKAYSLFITLLYINHHFWGGSIEGVLHNPVAITANSLEKQGLNIDRWKTRYQDLYMSFLGSLDGESLETEFDFNFFQDAFMKNPLPSLQNLSFQLLR